MPHYAIYRTMSRVTVRSSPSPTGAILLRLGKGREISGRFVDGWLEWVDGDVIKGYVRYDSLQRAKAVDG